MVQNSVTVCAALWKAAISFDFVYTSGVQFFQSALQIWNLSMVDVRHVAVDVSHVRGVFDLTRCM